MRQLARLTSRCLLVACGAWAVGTARAELPAAPAQPNASLFYQVTLSDDPAAAVPVTMSLAGANEVESIRLHRPPHLHIQHSTGHRESISGGGIRWLPRSLVGSLSYTIRLQHERAKGTFDSYHGGDWLVTRARDLFPRKSYHITAPLHLLTRVAFTLPPEWTVHTAMHPREATTFDAPIRHSPITSPYGWIMAGRLDVTTQQLQRATITIASPRSAKMDHTPLWELLRAVLPHMQRVTQQVPRRLFIGLAPDPFWRGGLSGEDSLLLNAGLPLIARDHTSTAIHELFHICQHAKKSSQQADWIVEGLAEYYSLKLLYVSSVLTTQQWRSGIKKLAKQSQWHTNFATSTARRVLYKAAPLVFFAIDHAIQDATHKTHSLDDVVTRLLAGDTISAKTLTSHLTYIAPNIDWAQWLTRHTTDGIAPTWEQWLKPAKTE